MGTRFERSQSVANLTILSACLMAASAALPVVAETAQEPAATVTKQDDREKDDGKKVVCRRENVVGTYMSRKICRTREQIDADRAKAQWEMDQINRMGRNPPPSSEG